MRRPPQPRLEALEARETPAAVGTLDPTFGGGKVTADAGPAVTGQALPAQVAVQSDGKVVVATTTYANGTGDFLVLRFNPDGSPDATFNANGTPGRIILDFGGSADTAGAVAIDPEGRIVVAGTGGADNADFAVARLNPTGVPDGMFNPGLNAGRMTVSVGPHDQGLAVAALGNGQILLAGSTDRDGTEDFAVVRLNPQGTGLDPSFQPGGPTPGAFVFDFAGGSDRATGLKVLPDGRIVAGGYTALPGHDADFAAVRIGPSGGLDPSFNPGPTPGRVTINFGGSGLDQALGLDVGPDGKAVLVGLTSGNGATDFAAARLNPDGTPDGSFADGGKGVYHVGTTGSARAVRVRPDGRVVIAGTTNASGNADFAVLRLTPGGRLDTSFNGNGQNVVMFGAQDQGTALALQPNGRVVVAGTSYPAAGTADHAAVAVARLFGSPELDSPIVVSGPGNGAGSVFTLQPDGQYGAAPALNLGPFAGFGGTVRSAVADVNGDGVADTVLVTGPGGPVLFAVLNGTDGSLLVPVTGAFESSFTGGGFVAAGDVDGDGRAEFAIAPDQGGGPRVQVYSLTTGGLVKRLDFFGIADPRFRGGARLAVGDVNADGFADLVVTAGFQGGPRVATFNGARLFASPGAGPAKLIANDFFAFDGRDAQTLRDGVYVALGDVDGDGAADFVFGGGPQGGQRVLVLSGALVSSGGLATAQQNPAANFFVDGDGRSRSGVRVAVKDVDGDNRADVVTGSGTNQASQIRVYRGGSFPAAGEPEVIQNIDPFNQTLTTGLFVG